MLVTCAGIIVADLIAAGLPKVSEPGELTFTELGIILHIGGHAANVSVDLLKLGLKRGEVSSIGAIGEDIFGDFIENFLKEHGVVCRLQKIKDVGTSKDLILVVKGEDRRFHVDVGANWYLSVEHVKGVLDEERPLIFYVGGSGFLGEFDERLPEVLKEAKGLGCLTFLDPVTPYKRGWDIFIPALRWTDIFHCNNTEAEMITGESEPVEAAGRLLGEGAKLALITMGDKGLIARTEDAILEMPAFKVKAVDPTGAGDAFCAGVIYGLIGLRGVRGGIPLLGISGDNLVQVLLQGEAAGAACVSMVGTTAGVTRERVDGILREQSPDVLGRIRMEVSGSDG